MPEAIHARATSVLYFLYFRRADYNGRLGREKTAGTHGKLKPISIASFSDLPLQFNCNYTQRKGNRNNPVSNGESLRPLSFRQMCFALIAVCFISLFNTEMALKWTNLRMKWRVKKSCYSLTNKPCPTKTPSWQISQTQFKNRFVASISVFWCGFMPSANDSWLRCYRENEVRCWGPSRCGKFGTVMKRGRWVR